MPIHSPSLMLTYRLPGVPNMVRPRYEEGTEKIWLNGDIYYDYYPKQDYSLKHAKMMF